MRILVALLLLAAVVVAAPPASAHGQRTAYLELTELGEGRVAARMRGADDAGLVVSIAGCARGADPRLFRCEGGLAGHEVHVDGLGAVVGDVVVTALLPAGEAPTTLLRPATSAWLVPDHPSAGEAVRRFFRAGLVHVLSGADHLLFLAALVLALRRPRAVIAAETAFTLSHSVTFSCAALGLLVVPPAAAEAGIALSLVLVALDLGRVTESARRGAAAAFVFGAVHGLGFAGGLADLGVPKNAALPALAGFALGIEAGQLLFLAAFFLVVRLASRLVSEARLAAFSAYAIGITGSFWLIDRALPLVRAAFPS